MAAVVEKKPEESRLVVPEEREQRSSPHALSQSPAPGSLMQALAIAAADPRMDVAKVKELFAMHKEVKAAAAKEAFVAAVAAFKANPPTIYKDKKNNQYSSKYTSIGNLVNTVNAALSPHGLSTRWNIEQAELIAVTCFLTHAMGHSEACTMKGPPDASGQKNPLQQIKSTVTYLKIATFEAVTGVASAEGNSDDDGNGAGGGETQGLTEKQIADFKAAIETADDEEGLKVEFGKAWNAAGQMKDRTAQQAFKDARDTRRVSLKRGRS